MQSVDILRDQDNAAKMLLEGELVAFTKDGLELVAAVDEQLAKTRR